MSADLAPRLALPALRRTLVAAPLLALGACDWFTDFKDQPRIEPWQSYAIGGDTLDRDSIPFRGQPSLSVPITGAQAPGYWVSYTPGIAQLDSMSVLVNPAGVTDASLENGRMHYQINCAVCHGITGEGNGPVTLYGYPAPSVVSAQSQAYSDGYLFGIIRNGRGLMPNYNRIEEMDRWDVVNYVRGLQGRLGRQVSTAPMAAPGVTGDSVPGATLMAPTRPAPYTMMRRGTGDSAAARGAPVAAPGAPGAQGVQPAAPGAQPGGAPAGATPAPSGTGTAPATAPDTSAQPGERR